MPCLNHLLHMGTTAMASTWPSPGKDLKSQPAIPLVNGTNLARLKQIPIYFFSGSENAVFTPEATDMSYTNAMFSMGLVIWIVGWERGRQMSFGRG